jgi:hypothetical protein
LGGKDDTGGHVQCQLQEPLAFSILNRCNTTWKTF